MLIASTISVGVTQLPRAMVGNWSGGNTASGVPLTRGSGDGISASGSMSGSDSVTTQGVADAAPSSTSTTAATTPTRIVPARSCIAPFCWPRVDRETECAW